MALTEGQRTNIFKAKYSGGTSFVSDVAKISCTSEPVMVIGLGGTGIDALLRVKKMVMETFISDDPSGIPSNIEFLALDTDLSSMGDRDKNGNRIQQKSYMGVVLDDSEKINISDDDFPGWLARPDLWKPYISEWFDDRLNAAQDATTGAGGYRQISRVCLFKKADEVVGKISNAIKPLVRKAAANENGKVHVYILTGISGGTGSGTFIDMAYFVRYSVETLLANPGRSDIAAYIVTPDISWENYQNNFILTNGYAALKELDYLMNLNINGDRFSQRYSPNIIIDTKERPFDLVHLVSGSFEDGTPVENCYDRAMNAISESILSFLSVDVTTDNNASSSLSVSGYMSNVAHSIDIQIDTMTQDERETVGYRYSILGYSGRNIPVKDIMNCLAKKLFDEVDKMMLNADPTDEQVDLSKNAGYTGLDLDSICAGLLTNTISLETLRNNPNLSKERVCSNGSVVNVKQIFDEMLHENTGKITANSNQRYFDEVTGKLHNSLGEFFSNKASSMSQDPNIRDLPREESTEFGPAWTNGLLVGCENTTHKYLLVEVERKLQQLQDDINNLDMNIKTVERNSNIEAIRQEAIKSILNRNKLYKQYIDTYVQLYQMKQSLHFSQVSRSFLIKIRDYIREENQKIFGVIKESLVSFAEVFNENEQYMSGDIATRKSVEGTVLEWNLINYTSIDEQIADMIDSIPINLTKVANRLYAHIWENIGDWSGESFDAFNDLRGFIGDEFQILLSKSIEHYLKLQFNKENTNGQYNSFSEYIQELTKKMENESRFLFAAGDAYRQTISKLMVKRELVLIPNGCLELKGVFDGLVNKDQGKEVGLSNLKTRISWLNTAHGLPLYAYGRIEDYEDIYEEGKEIRQTLAGAHLYGNRSNSEKYWFDLPSIVPASQRVEKKACPSEQRRRRDYNENFDKALKYGIIKYIDGYYKVRIAGNYDAEKLFEECKNDTGYEIVKLDSAKEILGNYLNPDKDLPYLDEEMERYDDRIINYTQTEEEARKWYMICYGLNKLVEKEIAKYEKIEEVYNKICELLDEKAKALKYIGIYAKIGILDLIKFNNPKYEYIFDGEPELIVKSSELAGVSLDAKGEFTQKSFPLYAIYKMIFLDGKMREHILGDPDDPADDSYSDSALVFAAFKGFNELEDKGGDEYTNAVAAFLEKVDKERKPLARVFDKIRDGSEIKEFYEALYNYVKGLV